MSPNVPTLEGATPKHVPVPPSSAQFVPVRPSSAQFVPVRPSSSQSAMLPLLLAALGAPGAAPFVLQVASFCSLAADGSLVATNGSQEVLVALSTMPLVCGDLRGPRAGACQQGGPLGALGDGLVVALGRDPRWGQRLQQRQRLCQELPRSVWPPPRAPPQLRIVPERSGPALALVCHAWGFSPAEITLRWLRNGASVGDTLGATTSTTSLCVPSAPPQLRIVPERSGPALALVCHAWGFSPAEITLRWLRNGASVGDTLGDSVGDTVGDTSGQSRVLPVGDGTFRTQATIQVPPGTSGDTFECVALHPTLKEPLSVTWAPGLSPRLSLLVALAVLALILGLLLFTFGLCRYLRTGYTPLPGGSHKGYTPLPGDTYAGSI
ncbi:class II histocompatibility antigen, M beta 1 chain [Passer montanus]|uniref:class II histocompatibility antigen, M beta 1 chain n=1 Tax=Passer montanus TaxID=9160 RepID=UPI001960C77C|nr:class II histocompatibility antigen, M beta 1 chain [Passer montanus]